MRYLLIILSLACSCSCIALTPDITQLRALYYKAPENKDATDQLLQATEHVANASPLIKSYKGIALMLKANFSANPYYKFSYFKQGRILLDEAIKLDPQNTEIRFMRFCAQTNTPSFLGYKDEINTDKEIILRSWRSLTDNELKQKIKSYMAISGYCDHNEISALI